MRGQRSKSLILLHALIQTLLFVGQPFTPMRSICLLTFCLLVKLAYGWSSFDHQLITQESLESYVAKWKLFKPVPLRSFDEFLGSLSKEKPEIRSRDDFARWLGINPHSNFDLITQAESQLLYETAPIAILRRHCVTPDEGMDQDLFIVDKDGKKRPLFPEMKWFGAMGGINSQAFRHIEKPPFNPLHPIRTFGVPLGKLGQATGRVQIYFDLAVLARNLGHEYWGWRLLAYALHYLNWRKKFVRISRHSSSRTSGIT